MPTRYFGRHPDLLRRTINTSGQQAGPPAGDGWQAISTLPAATVGTSGLTAIAFWVTGRISNIQPYGNLPPSPTGVLQVCLGSSNGTRSGKHLFHVSVQHALASPVEGIPFSFLVICSPDVTDPTWGAQWPGTADLQVLARLWWAQDSPTYGVEWDVSDIEFVWANLADIPSADFNAWSAEGSWPLATSPDTAIDSLDVVELDEQWVHFACVTYVPGRDPSVPYFRFGLRGATVAEFDEKVGRRKGAQIVPHGLGWQSAQYWNRRRTQGAFWCEQGDGVHKQPGLRARDQQPGPDAPVVERVAILSVRLDNLPSVILTSDEELADFTDYHGAVDTTERFKSIEVGNLQLSWEPMVLAGMVVHQAPNPGRRSHALHLSDDAGEIFSPVIGFVTSEPPNAAQVFMASGQGIGFGDPGFQYRLKCLQPGDPPPSPVHHPVRDVYVAVFHPVRDPDGQAPTVPPVGAAVPIVPGAEGPPPASLQKPPLAPNVAVRPDQLTRPERLAGSTGYVRTWGVWLKSRRTFSLSWEPVSRADRDALIEWLRAARVWALRPPRASSDIAVAVITAPEAAQVSAQTFRVDVDVAELVYTV